MSEPRCASCGDLLERSSAVLVILRAPPLRHPPVSIPHGTDMIRLCPICLRSIESMILGWVRDGGLLEERE